MTAQIGVINKKCVALATDSAVTVGYGKNIKAFNTAEKLFTLSNNAPVGIMIYNNAEFLGIPWEILIKEYRKKCCSNKYSNLVDYANDFFKFVNEYNQFNVLEIRHSILRVALTHLEIILDSTSRILKEITDVNPSILKEIILDNTNKYSSFIDNHLGEFYTNNSNDIMDYYIDFKSIVTNNINMEKIPLDEKELDSIIKYMMKATLSDIYSSNKTGIVIAGYGEEEIFPSIYEYEIELKLGDYLKYKLIDSTEIGCQLEQDKNDAAIMTFAQSEMAHTFLTGINPELRGKLIESLNDIIEPLSIRYKEVCQHMKLQNAELNEEQEQAIDTLGQSILQSVIEDFQETQQDRHIEPFIQMVKTLDKQQMAELAETLVSLTSFKRKMSMDTETVGGPIDVAIISKGEGFIWIKRKEYFESKLNNHYFTKDCQYVRRDFND
ncbi:hypothetical protein PBV87_00240 [Niameybacter massiliensis]|uniref:Uncharacterized protein n=1 Tax=Holtiella tumoricola TaxID=3018743 RepID=A0AA42DJ96_9FIRM|nr:hypothetical protein [Holtiella tumoricola]MDA3729941.1 hypothetical protein [Holtiella tumoricola]